MATAELEKPHTKTKHRSMPASIGRLDNAVESDNPPTLPPIQASDPDHHILDLLLNENFDDLDYELMNSTDTNVSERGEASTSLQTESDTQDSSESSSLLKNSGKEEINNVLLSPDVIESLTTVKHVALVALASLLRQIVADDTMHASIPSEISGSADKFHALRRRSYTTIDSDFKSLSGKNRDAWIRSQLLADIAQNATKLGSNSEMQEQVERVSLPDLATLNEIQNHLRVNSPTIPSDSYSLACALAALLGYLYRILELSESDASQSEQEPISGSQSAEEILQNVNGDNIYTALRNEVTNMQIRHSNLADQTNASDERVATWNEIQRLMEIISSLCRERSITDPPPRYSTTVDERDRTTFLDPPKYSPIGAEKMNNEKTQRDLDNVISAIERVYYVAPQLTNQRVELNHRQAKQISAAILTTAIQRLSRGRLEEQRAVSTSVVKYQALNRLIEQINKSASRSFVDQRVELNPRQIRHLEAAKLNNVIERLEKNRMIDQDWHPPEQLLVQDLTRLAVELNNSTTYAAYASQRFQLSPLKERDMFMNSVIKKVEKMKAYRMDNQDADPPSQRRERAFQEIEGIMDKLSHSPAMENQRAVWNPKDT